MCAHRRMCENKCLGMQIAYGSTETSPISFMSKRSEAYEDRATSVGAIGDHIEAMIVDDDGHIVPIGQKGELLTRGYGTMLGYWADAQRTAETVTPDRWFHTG